MNGGKGVYVGGTLLSILISLALYATAGASRRSSSGCGPRPYSTWARASWRKTKRLLYSRAELPGLSEWDYAVD